MWELHLVAQCFDQIILLRKVYLPPIRHQVADTQRSVL